MPNLCTFIPPSTCNGTRSFVCMSYVCATLPIEHRIKTPTFTRGRSQAHRHLFSFVITEAETFGRSMMVVSSQTCCIFCVTQQPSSSSSSADSVAWPGQQLSMEQTLAESQPRAPYKIPSTPKHSPQPTPQPAHQPTPKPMRTHQRPRPRPRLSLNLPLTITI